jgi:hypothetical protein
MYHSYSSEDISHHRLFHIFDEAMFTRTLPLTSKWQTSGNEIVKMVEIRYEPRLIPVVRVIERLPEIHE